MNNLEEAAENFRVIYNKAWALFSGVKPMTREEALEMVREMKPIIDPRIIFFAYFNEEPIGFFITVPDLNRLIGKFNGKFGLWQKLRLMWDLKVRRSCDRIFGIIFGIAPEFHGKGAVSYTHLDVYKRQVMSTSRTACRYSLSPGWRRSSSAMSLFTFISLKF